MLLTWRVQAWAPVLYDFVQKTQPIVEEEEEEEVRKQPDPLHQLILHFSHNALTECRYVHTHRHTQGHPLPAALLHLCPLIASACLIANKHMY